MVNFNRFLIILITLLAIAAAVMSYFLFERRNEFRNRATALSDTVAAIVQNLDEESGTQMRQTINFNPPVPEEGIAESGSLSWQEFHQNAPRYKSLLSQAEELATTINNQKNFLADNIAQIGFDLGMPIEDLSKQTLKNASPPENYKNATNSVSRLAKAVNSRSNAMIQTHKNSANTIGYSINESQLRERQTETTKEGRTIRTGFKHEQALNGYLNAVVQLNTRCADYANALANLTSNISAYDWSTDTEQLKSSDQYGGALTSLQNDARDINDKLVELKQKTKQLADLRQKLSNVQSELQEVVDQRNALQERAGRLKTQVETSEEAPTEGAQAQPEKPKEISLGPDARVLQVNREWNFVIINRGSNVLREGVELAIARDGKFLARAKVTKVTPTISIANIIPEVQKGKIQPDDRVHTSSSM